MKHLACSCVLALTIPFHRALAQTAPAATIQFGAKSAGVIGFRQLPDVWHAQKFKAALGTVDIQAGQVIGISFGYDGSSRLCSIADQAADRIVALDFHKCAFNKSQAKCLQRFRHLVDLNLANTDCGDREMEYLRDLNEITNLNLSHTLVTSKGFSAISTMKKLYILFAGFTRLDDSALAKLKNKDQIRQLIATSTNLSDKSLATLGGFKNIDDLVLNRNPKITDLGLTHLLNCSKLRDLNIDDTGVTERSLATLSKMQSLKTLVIPNQKPWSAATVQKLREALPHCHVSTGNSLDRFPPELFAPLHSTFGDKL